MFSVSSATFQAEVSRWILELRTKIYTCFTLFMPPSIQPTEGGQVGEIPPIKLKTVLHTIFFFRDTQRAPAIALS